MQNKLKELVEAANKKNITTTEIIQKSGVGRTQFYSILNGDSIPKLTTAFAIAKALDVDLKEVFPEVDEEGV
jgi:DNA-binding XRE family transcriptional regulator